jgi:thioredoxin reductase
MPEESGRGVEGEPRDEVYDVVIVGGSFAGVSAALQIARARRKVLVLDGGKPRNRFTKAAHGFLGQDGRPPKDIIADARKQVLAYPTARFRDAEATDAARDGDGPEATFRLAVAGGEVRARRVVLATGVVDHLPDVPGVREMWGAGVGHCPYCHGYEVADRKLVVLGVGEPSVHQALLLRDWSDDVTLLTNAAFTPTAEDRERLRARGVRVDEAPVARLVPDRPGGRDVGAVEFRDGRRMACGGVFTSPRVTLASGLAEKLGCETEPGQSGPFVKTDARKATTVPGVFAAGDLARAMHNATMASADGVMAGSAAHQSLVFPPKAG